MGEQLPTEGLALLVAIAPIVAVVDTELIHIGMNGLTIRRGPVLGLLGQVQEHYLKASQLLRLLDIVRKSTAITTIMECNRCGTELEIGMFPFCRGNPADHGTIFRKTSGFPFEARHITPDGKSMTIDSLQHLRKVEKEYGVVLSAFSKSNIHDVDPIKDLPRYRGEDEDFRRDHR